MKKVVIALLISLSAVAVIVYLLLQCMVDFGYKINIIDGRPSGLTKYHDEEYYKEKATYGHFIVIRDGEERVTYKFDELGIKVDMTGYESSKYTINTQNIDYKLSSGNMEPIIRDTLEDMLSRRTSGSVGKFEITDDGIIISGAEECNLFSVDAIISSIAVQLGVVDTIAIDVNDYIIEQNADMINVQQSMEEECSKFNELRIAYTDKFVIDSYVLHKYSLLKVSDDSIEFIDDLDKVVSMLSKNLVGYNSVGIDRQFITHDGKSITVSGGTYGDYIDYTSEAKEVLDMLVAFKSEDDRVPIMKQEAKFSLDTTYLEVDKVKQHVYYYVDGSLTLDTDVVTGLPTSDRETPSGVYFILNKTTDANLIGATWNVKSDRWMGVTYQGVGFHDASWRSKFGGAIYKSNGSHGCINTPKEAMYELYDMVEEGTPVVIY